MRTHWGRLLPSLRRTAMRSPMTTDHLATNPITRRVNEFATRVHRVQERQLYLYLEPVEALRGPRVTIAGRSVLLGASYSYLGLLGHPEIEAAANAAVAQYGTGTHGVRLLAGNTDLHDRLERRIATFIGADTAAGYSSRDAAHGAALPPPPGRRRGGGCHKTDPARIIPWCPRARARPLGGPHN